jgi:hypothetical protein
VLAVAHGPLRRSVHAARPFACGLAAMLAATAAGATAAQADVATAPRTPELVTTADTGSADIFNAIRNTPDGSAIAFESLGGFADAPANILLSTYRSRRTASGWVVDGSLNAPSSSPAPALGDASTPADVSDDLGTAYIEPVGTSFDALDQNPGYDVFTVTGGKAQWLTPALTLPDTANGNSMYVGRSATGGHVIIESDKHLLAAIPDDSKNRVYDYTGGKLRLVSIPPAGAANPADPTAHFGAGRQAAGYQQPADARAISLDGSRIYFQMGGQLYVRVDGKTTNLVSASQIAGDPRGPVAGAAAKFLGASDDGHIVYFSAAVPLVTGATTGGLYMYDEDADALSLLAPIDSTGGGHLGGSIRTAQDGARIYFVATSALTADATAGQDNIYVVGDVGLRFIATINAANAYKLYAGGEYNNEIALSANGRRLAFPSTRILTGPRAQQNGGYPQIYTYNLDGGALACVSCPPDGSNGTDEASLRDVPGNQLVTPLAFADDGTVFFDAKDPLTADDTDDHYDVYANDADGNHLLTPGTPDQDVYITGNSADGRDVFVRTHAALTADDDDGGYADLYDLRIGGGFAAPATPCSGEACRGPQTPQPTAQDAAPASLTATDTSTASVFTTPVTTFKVRSLSAASRATWARTGKVTLSVKVSALAQVTAKATAKLPGAKKATTVASATKLQNEAGTVKLVLSLSARARSALKRLHKLTVKLAVTCTDSKKAATATVVLRTKAAKR